MMMLFIISVVFNIFIGIVYSESIFDAGSWIVSLDKACSHNKFRTDSNVFARGQNTIFISHEYESIFHGVAVKGISRSDLLTMDCVTRVVKDTKKYLIGVPSWGIDRIDQKKLPLDDSFTTYYHGDGVDVYILDTGLDTNHDEFHGNSRTVQNIYSIASTDKYNPPSNTDGNGHGTHVAGTIGGNSVGIARKANIYALKILGDDGSGSTSDILHGFDLIKKRVVKSKRPSIMSMSLGGDCDDSDCSKDSLVKAVENLYTIGVISSVAAGNSGCNGCYGSPNAAPHAINVGATDKYDKVAYFSNYGQCIDIFAPGYDIISSATSKLTGNEHSYATMSGTSMACPHVTGVLALLLQKNLHATVDELYKAITCDGMKYTLHMAALDTISRNILLQIPTNSNDFGTCDLAKGCVDECNSNGVCQYSRSLEYFDGMISKNITSCYCNGNVYGQYCNEVGTDSTCSMSGMHRMRVSMTDTYGDGWTFASFSITQDKSDGKGHMIVDNALDSLCSGDSDSRSYCLQHGTYRYTVSKGLIPSEVGWSFCGITAGAPYRGDFTISSNGHCAFTCSNGHMTTLTLHDEYGDGWGEAYYTIYEKQTGDQIYGGSLHDGKSINHLVCMQKEICYIVFFQSFGDVPHEISMAFCDFTMYVDDIIEVCINELNVCQVQHVSLDSESKQSCNDVDKASDVIISLLNFEPNDVLMIDSTLHMDIRISELNTSNIVADSSLHITEFIGVDLFCLLDGCYDIMIDMRDKNDIIVINDVIDSRFLWSMCGVRGNVPYEGKVCVDHRTGMCYGLTGCPTIVSTLQHSSSAYLVVAGTEYDAYYDESVVVVSTLENVHGVHELCGLSNGVHSIYVGAAHWYASDVGGSSTNIATTTICDTEVSLPIHGSISVYNNTCEVIKLSNYTCTDNKINHDLIKLDTYGDGWGRKNSYTIRKVSHDKEILYSGTLSDGQYEVDHLCFINEQCYTLTVSASVDVSEILWIMCGYIGEAPVSYLEFCVHGSNTCSFTHITDESYIKLMDDDFDNIVDDYNAKTISPSKIPSHVPTHATKPPVIHLTHRPTCLPSSESTYRPTCLPSFESTQRPTFLPSSEHTHHPTCLPSSEPTHSVNSQSITPSISSSQTSTPTTSPSKYSSKKPTTQPTGSRLDSFDDDDIDDDQNIEYGEQNDFFDLAEKQFILYFDLTFTLSSYSPKLLHRQVEPVEFNFLLNALHKIIVQNNLNLWEFRKVLNRVAHDHVHDGIASMATSNSHTNGTSVVEEVPPHRVSKSTHIDDVSSGQTHHTSDGILGTSVSEIHDITSVAINEGEDSMEMKTRIDSYERIQNLLEEYSTIDADVDISDESIVRHLVRQQSTSQQGRHTNHRMNNRDYSKSSENYLQKRQTSLFARGNVGDNRKKEYLNPVLSSLSKHVNVKRGIVEGDGANDNDNIDQNIDHNDGMLMEGEMSHFTLTRSNTLPALPVIGTQTEKESKTVLAPFYPYTIYVSVTIGILLDEMCFTYCMDIISGIELQLFQYYENGRMQHIVNNMLLLENAGRHHDNIETIYFHNTTIANLLFSKDYILVKKDINILPPSHQYEQIDDTDDFIQSEETSSRRIIHLTKWQISLFMCGVSICFVFIGYIIVRFYKIIRRQIRKCIFCMCGYEDDDEEEHDFGAFARLSDVEDGNSMRGLSKDSVSGHNSSHHINKSVHQEHDYVWDELDLSSHGFDGLEGESLISAIKDKDKQSYSIMGTTMRMGVGDASGDDVKEVNGVNTLSDGLVDGENEDKVKSNRITSMEMKSTLTIVMQNIGAKKTSSPSNIRSTKDKKDGVVILEDEEDFENVGYGRL